MKTAERVTNNAWGRARWTRRLVEAGVLLGLFVAVRAWQRRGVAEDQAPAFEATTVAGERVVVPGERPTLVHFWATWCGVCDAMDGNVAAVASDARVVTVAVHSGGATAVVAALAEDGLATAGRPVFPVVVDSSGALAARWGVSAYPTSFVVDTAGQIRSVEVGYTSEFGLRARLALAN